ncbi:PREDICTED: uncharacterized protein LOC108975759 [Bactrocera latifrons]|uniref:uncharacterized protein LOC108975759 n=1 Tax=Bactrocera latifrons TaxID=174628 RepID=UPI0008DD030E|nr:PREDICTED: uncharacterized protein LOC108975759 [Bactrocera latifrons]
MELRAQKAASLPNAKKNTLEEATTHWDFYEEMYDVYGTRSDVTVPQETLDSSLYDILSGTGGTNDFLELDSTSPKSKSKLDRKKCEVVSFLEKEASADKEILKELMQVEKKKLEVDKQKVEEMRSLRLLLTSMSNYQ